MSEWPSLSLGDLTETTRPICYGVLKPGPDVEFGVPLIRIQDLHAGSVRQEGLHSISTELDAEFARSRLSGGEVLLSIQGTIGRVAICPKRLAGANISRTIAVIHPDDRIRPEFLAFWLRHLATRSAFPTQGSTRASLNIGDLRKVRIPLPPLDEQRRIVATLDEALGEINELKRNREAKIDAFDDVKASILTELLQPNPGAAVSDWETVPLGEVATVSAGNPAPQGQQAFAGGSLPFIRTSDVGAIHVGEIRTTRDQVNATTGKKLKLFPAGTVLFPKSGASTFTNHRVLMRCDAYVASHLAAIKANATDALDEYLFYYLQTVDARDLVQDQSYPSLNLKAIAAIPIPLPPLDEQRRIVATLDEAALAVDSGKAAATGELELADAMASSLMTELLTAA